VTAKEDLELALADFLNESGTDLDHWVRVVGRTAGTNHQDILQELRVDHGLPFNVATALSRFHGNRPVLASPSIPTGEHALHVFFGGRRAHLLPAYKRLMHRVRGLGNDVTVRERPTFITARRQRPFLMVRANNKALRMEMRLPGANPRRRLEPIEVAHTSMTHFVVLRLPDDVDTELRAWLLSAYQNGISPPPKGA